MYLSPFCLAYGCPMRPRASRYRGRSGRTEAPWSNGQRVEYESANNPQPCSLSLSLLRLVENRDAVADFRAQVPGSDDDKGVSPVVEPKPGLGPLMIDDHES